MKRSRVTQEQIVGVLKEHGAGASAPDLCRKHGCNHKLWPTARHPRAQPHDPHRQPRLRPPLIRPGQHPRLLCSHPCCDDSCRNVSATTAATSAQVWPMSRRNRRADGYQGVSDRASSHRQSGARGSRMQTGLFMAPTRCATDVSTVISRSRFCMTTQLLPDRCKFATLFPVEVATAALPAGLENCAPLGFLTGVLSKAPVAQELPIEFMHFSFDANLSKGDVLVVTRLQRLPEDRRWPP